jgi:hypothetical protein
MDEEKKYSLRPTVDRKVENPSIGYRLENIQALSLLDNIRKTVTMSYNVIDVTGSITGAVTGTIANDQTKEEIIKKFSISAEKLRQVIDGGVVEHEGKMYMFQTQDRALGKHGEIMEKLAANSDEQYDGEMIVDIPLVRVDENGNFVRVGTCHWPFKFDTRFASVRISESALTPDEVKNFKPSIRIIPKQQPPEEAV